MDKEIHILVVDNEIAILHLLKEILEIKGYKVTTAQSGKEALEKLKEKIPHLIILDVLMPEMSGYEVCLAIRKRSVFKYLPIIILTAKDSIEDEIDGWRMGIDEYIVKPFNTEELLAIINATVHRTYLGIDANPLTKLPGNNTIREEINRCIESKKHFAICFLDLDNFKAFNDHYGFDKGDEAIKLTAEIIINTIHKTGGDEQDFIGHIGGDDFVVIADSDRVDIICQEIIKEFDKTVPDLYLKEDRQRGYIISLNRKGEKEEFPIMTISIAVVTNKKRNLTHLAQISTIGAELKEYAKTFFGSNYIIDKRMEEEKDIFKEGKKIKENILLVDDDSDICTILSKILKKEGYQIITAQSGTSALAQIKEKSFNVVFLDIKLPDMSGLEVLRTVKGKAPNAIVVIMTGYSSIDVAIEAFRYGAYDYLEKPLDVEKVKVIIKRGIERQRLEIKNKNLLKSLTEKNIELNKKVEETLMLNKGLQALYIRTMGALVGTIEAKDQYTRGHSDRVTKYVGTITNELNLSENEQEFIRYACELHDIGKIGIRDYILTKSEALTKEEWNEIKLHPITAANILKPLEFLDEGISFIRHHHERYDGKGYPYGLKMEDIPLGARIISVADAFDAMTSDRPYRKTKSVKEAIEELKKHAGTQFDPKIVEAFLKVLEKKI